MRTKTIYKFIAKSYKRKKFLEIAIKFIKVTSENNQGNTEGWETSREDTAKT